MYYIDNVNKFDRAHPLDEADAILLMPPPNLTGHLHIGHILNMSIGDFVVRYSYLFYGLKTVPVLGFDHAALYAEIVARNMLVSSSKSINKESILEQINANRKLFRDSIIRSYDSYKFFRLKQVCHTDDAVACNIIKKALAKLESEGLIFEDYKTFNYDCELNSIVSDLECKVISEYKNLYYIKYMLVSNDALTSNNYVVVATTMPFTIEADLLLAVHPDDNNNNHLIGKFAINPLTGNKIPIIGHVSVEPTFGSGILKVSPLYSRTDTKICHSINFKIDYELPYDSNLFMNDKSVFKGAHITQLNDIAVKMLAYKDSIIKVESVLSKSTISNRSGNKLIEIILKQKFIDMPKMMQMINIDDNIQIVGCSGKNDVRMFIDGNLTSWCISRQNIYGHSLDENNRLDTWFSSSLWIDIVSEYFNTVYEKDIIICTGYDIMFFWIFKMLCMHRFMNDKSDRKICIIVHGLLCDSSGSKISKSKGNAPNIDSNDHTQIDINRLKIMLSSVLSKRIKLDESYSRTASRYINKIKNITNFISVRRPVEPFKSLSCGRSLIANIVLYKLYNYLSSTAISNISKISVPFELMNTYLSKVMIPYIQDCSDKAIITSELKSLKLLFGLILKFAYCIIPYTSHILYYRIFSDDIESIVYSDQILMMMSHEYNFIEAIDCLISIVKLNKGYYIDVKVKNDSTLNNLFVNNNSCKDSSLLVTYDDDIIAISCLKSEVSSLKKLCLKLGQSNLLLSILNRMECISKLS